MSGKVAVTLFHHADTEKAILVGPNRSHDDKDNVWLPLSQIEVGEKHHIRNPLFGQAPHIGEWLGTVVDLLVPQWLVDKNNLPTDYERNEA